MGTHPEGAFMVPQGYHWLHPNLLKEPPNRTAFISPPLAVGADKVRPARSWVTRGRYWSGLCRADVARNRNTCQSASKVDPRSASNFAPWRRVELDARRRCAEPLRSAAHRRRALSWPFGLGAVGFRRGF